MIDKRRLMLGMGGLALAGIVARPDEVLAQAAGAPAPVDSTLDRVRSSKKLRISAIVGAEPYFKKNLADGSWSGVGVEMAASIARPLDATVEYVETTYANAILDLRSGRTDLAFSLNPTPERALSIGFTRPYYLHPYSLLAKSGFQARTWADVNKPETRLCASNGTLPDVLVRRYAPRAQVVVTKTIDEGVLAVQTGRADAIITAVLQALSIKIKNQLFSTIIVPEAPRIALPTCLGVRQEASSRWTEYLNAWIDYNASSGQVMDWIAAELGKGGITRDQIPT